MKPFGPGARILRCGRRIAGGNGMFGRLILILGLALLAGKALAQEEEIEAVIAAQMEAFRAEDAGQAFTYASPMIQSMFGNAQTFGMMVQRGYPMVWDNASVEFLELRREGPFVWQKLLLRDEAGALHVLDYQMMLLGGDWRINGVQLVPAPDVGA